MTGLGIGLLALAIGDLWSGGLSGEPASAERGLRASLLVVALAGLGAAGFAPGWGAAAALVVPVAVAAVTWTRRPTHGGRGLALAGLAATLVLLVGLGSLWEAARTGWLDRLIDGLPVRLLAGLDGERALLLAGVVGALLGSSNGIVRSMLSLAGTDIVRSEQRLRGGRLIGVLERLLIFGLALAGQPTAAALIISAKSILRFPELSNIARREVTNETGDEPQPVDIVTEYFLLGSMISWALALGAALLMA